MIIIIIILNEGKFKKSKHVKFNRKFLITDPLPIQH